MTDFWAPRTYPRARKEHKCCTCYRTISPGETYTRSFGVYDGEPNPWKQCAHCEALLPYIDWDEGFSAEDYQEWEPRTIEELRVKAHWRKHWRNNAGELYPIPFQTKATEAAET